jgi:hypothetical protein
MEKERVEKILELVTDEEKVVVGTVFNATVENFQAYQKEKSAAKLNDWRASSRELEKLVERLETKYLTGAKQLKNTMAALRYLKEHGWKIQKSKLYKDRDRGLFAVNADKSIDEVEILAYAARWLEKIASCGPDDEDGELAKSKLKGDISYNDLRQKKLQLEYDKERGKLISRAQYLVELVSKLSAARFVPLQVIRSKAPDLIVAVGGKLEKQEVFLKLYTEYIEAAFDELAKLPELKFRA